MQEPPLWKRNAVRGLIFLWLAFQFIFPLARKFNFPHFQYQFATFSWGMYSKPALSYEVSFFREDASGSRKEIEGIKNFVREYQSPGSIKLYDYYRTREQIEDWNKQLVEAVAGEKKDGFIYGASIRWLRQFDPNKPSDWEFKITAEKPS